jgi:peptidoglycan/xylan/chitin deacetylase (PgdA/CDA1 family)
LLLAVSMSVQLRPHYLVRFDDICPTLPWDQWSRMEEVLLANDIRPIVAVIPDNKDVSLHKGPADKHFWNRVRMWKKMGWTIALHGYQHLYVSKSSGMVGLNQYSEFAGLSFEEQYRKLHAGLKIFKQEDLHPEVWVAPAHTFDENTLLALKSLEIKVISDGFHLWPHTDREGLFWIPQQIARFYSMPCGTWTVCIHPEDRLCSDPRLFRRKIERFREYIVDVPKILSLYSGKNPNLLGETFAQMLRWVKVVKSAMT